MNRAVFLDRDNTIIHADDDITHPDEVRLITGAASAIASLRGLGYRIIVISNQTGVAHGNLTEADVDAVNRRIAELVQYNSGATIDRFYYCPYHPEATVEQYRADHPWRKPSPGMLERAAEDLDIDLRASWTVGDHRHDIAAGRAAGTRTVLLQPIAPAEGYSLESSMSDDDLESPHFVARSLVEAVRLIAQRPPAEKLEPAHARSAQTADDEASDRDESADDDEPVETIMAGDRPDAPSAAPEADDADAADTGEPGDEAAAPSPEPARTGPRPTSPPPEPPHEAEAEAKAEPSESLADSAPVLDTAPAPATARDGDEGIPSPPTPRPTPRDDTLIQPPAAEQHSSGIPSPPHGEFESARQPHLRAQHQPTADTPRGEPAEPTANTPSPADAPGQQPPAAADPALTDVLRSIQRELKARRADYGDFSYAKMAAVLCQMLAVGCVLFGMINLAEVDTFARWMLGATFSQMLVITLLIVHGQR